MFALALKDLFLIRREKVAILFAALSLIIYAIVYVMPSLALVMGIMPAYSLLTWTCAYDFKYRSDSFVNSLPVSRLSVVAAKFLSPILALAGSMALCAVGWALFRIIGGGLASPPLGFAVVCLGFGMVMWGLYLAGFFILGFQNGRWMNIISFGIIFAATGAAGVFKTGSGGAISGPGSWSYALVAGTAPLGWYAAALAIGGVVYVLAFMASYIAYRRKEF